MVPSAPTECLYGVVIMHFRIFKPGMAVAAVPGDEVSTTLFGSHYPLLDPPRQGGAAVTVRSVSCSNGVLWGLNES